MFKLYQSYMKSFSIVCNHSPTSTCEKIFILRSQLMGQKRKCQLDVFPFCWYLCYHEEMKSRVIPVCPLSYYCSPDSAKANYFMWLCTVICQRSLSQLMKSGMNGKSNLNWSLDAGKDWSNKLSLKTTQLLLVLMYLQRRYLLNNHSFDIFL